MHTVHSAHCTDIMQCYVLFINVSGLHCIAEGTMTEVSATHTDTTPQRCTQSEIFRDYCVETHQALPVSTMNSTIIGSVRTTEARKRILSLSIKYIIFLPSILPKPCAISSFLCSTLHAVIKKKKTSNVDVVLWSFSHQFNISCSFFHSLWHFARFYWKILLFYFILCFLENENQIMKATCIVDVDVEWWRKSLAQKYSCRDQRMCVKCLYLFFILRSCAPCVVYVAREFNFSVTQLSWSVAQLVWADGGWR